MSPLGCSRALYGIMTGDPAPVKVVVTVPPEPKVGSRVPAAWARAMLPPH